MPTAPQHGLFTQTAGSAVLLLGIGIALCAAGIVVASNWRGWAEHYTDVVDAMTPTLHRPRFLRPQSPDEQWRKVVRQSRITFAVVACMGLLMIVSGTVSLLRVA